MISLVVKCPPGAGRCRQVPSARRDVVAVSTTCSSPCPSCGEERSCPKSLAPKCFTGVAVHFSMFSEFLPPVVLFLCHLQNTGWILSSKLSDKTDQSTSYHQINQLLLSRGRCAWFLYWSTLPSSFLQNLFRGKVRDKRLRQSDGQVVCHLSRFKRIGWTAHENGRRHFASIKVRFARWVFGFTAG